MNIPELLLHLTQFSPILLTLGITSLSILFQNTKGIIYLAFLIASCILRHYTYTLINHNPPTSSCNLIQYVPIGNDTLSCFLFSFTLMYISYPMFHNNSVNYPLFSMLIIYFLLDLLVKLYSSCILSTTDLAMNILGGSTLALLFTLFMYAGGSSSFLFFNEISPDKEVCNMPNKQTFKCKMYKDGVLVGSL